MNLPTGTFDGSSKSSVPAQKQGGFLSQSSLALFMLVPVLGVMALIVFFPPDGTERADWFQFIGRFHPLVVHFPIALFLLVPVLEIVGRRERFAYLRLSIDFVLALATLAAVTAASLGWCLARSGGYSGKLIAQHMWGGVLLSLLCCCCWRARKSEVGATYAIALALGVGLVAWTGYRGGQLSLGPRHLTELMPGGLRTLLGVNDSEAAIAADPNTFYGAQVQPIFAARCVACHGADKQKGNLRLDSYRGLVKGGKDGVVIRAGSPQGSDLFRRITLPSNHDDFMPKGKQPLSTDQVKVIELWIGAGASDTLAANAIKNVPTASAVRTEVTVEEIDPAAVTKLRSAVAATVSHLQKQFPNILDYDSRSSADLRLNASTLQSKFSDEDLEAFAPIAGHIVVADFSRTAVTDQSAAAIATMKRLRVLRLVGTRITDAALLRFDSLSQLESLDVYGTQVTPAVLPIIARLPKLSHFYAGQTGIQPGQSLPGSLVGKLVF